MNFRDLVVELLASDASLNNAIDGGIYQENLIDQWLGETSYDKWIVWDFNKIEQQDALLNSKNVFTTYELNLVLIQRSHNDEIDTISDYIVNFLNGNELKNIKDIFFLSDEQGYDQERDIYTNTLVFNAFYVK